MKAVQARVIDVAAIQDVKGAWLAQQLVENGYVVEIAVADIEETRYVAAQVHQRMQLHRGVGGLIVGPRKHRKAQLDQRRIERIDRVGKIQLQRVVGVQGPCPVDQRLRKLCVNAPIARLV